MTAELVSLYETNLRDPAATLRKIADAIEAGEYGEVGCIAIALLGNEMEVFSAGPDSDGPSAAVLLQAGALRIVKTIESHGREDR